MRWWGWCSELGVRAENEVLGLGISSACVVTPPPPPVAPPQDVCQGLEKLKAAVLSLSASARRLSDKEEAERAAAALQASYDVSVQQAKDKQSQLEGLLSLWQK